MKVRLTLKLAEFLDGIDVSHYRVGDVLTLSDGQAELLVAEGWAAEAADPPTWRPGILEQLQNVRNRMKHRRFERHERRRAEDRIRDELHDSRAKTLGHDPHDWNDRPGTAR